MGMSILNLFLMLLAAWTGSLLARALRRALDRRNSSQSQNPQDTIHPARGPESTQAAKPRKAPKSVKAKKEKKTLKAPPGQLFPSTGGP